MIIDKKGCYLETKADDSLFCLYKLCQIRYNKTIYERRWDGMDVSERMKYKLANAMKELLVHTPVDKITVKQIVDQCNVIRPTFYRHFKDKYDLINWYFDRILLESFQHMGEGKTAYEGLVNKFHYIEEEKLFFKAAFRNDDQNCLRDHDFQLILRFYENQIQEKTKQPIPENLHFQLEMYCQGSVYMTTQWVLGDMKKRPEEMARNLVAAMPTELETLFKKLELL